MGGGGLFTLRAPLASSQVELRATFSSWPHSGQGLCRGLGGQHMQTFPSCVGVEKAAWVRVNSGVPHISPDQFFLGLPPQISPWSSRESPEPAEHSYRREQNQPC